MGANVQVCWEKFCRYWEVEPRLVPMEGERYHLTAERGGRALRREHDRRRGDPRARRSTAATSRSRRSPTRWTSSRPTRASTSRCTSTPPRADSWRRSSQPDLEWDFRIPRVQSINASGHKYGLVYPGVGWAIWRDQEALPRDLIFDVNYLGGHMPTFALNFSPPGQRGRRPVLHVHGLGTRGLHEDDAGPAGHRHCTSRAASRSMGPYRLISDGRRAAGVRVRARSRRSRTTRCSTSRTACASAAGWSPPTPSRRTAQDLSVLRVVVRAGHDTWRWPTCCSTTWARRPRCSSR